MKLLDIERRVFCLKTPAVQLLSTHFAHAFSELNLHVKNSVNNEIHRDKLFLVWLKPTKIEKYKLNQNRIYVRFEFKGRSIYISRRVLFWFSTAELSC